MEKQKYQLSMNIRVIPDSESELAMVYHTLYGNPRIVNKEGLRFLDLFKQPATIEETSKICDEAPRETIQEFAKIFFLIKHGFNEKEFLHKQKDLHLSKVSAGQTIDRMGLAISDSCNFGCVHCIHFQPSSNNGVMLPIYQKPAEQLNMSWETAKKCIDQYVALIREQGHNHCKIHFGNAEPLINWPVIKKILHYCDGMDNLTFEFAINTNLVLMTREIAEAFKKYQVRIATSLDGTLQANDAIRISKGGHGTFDRIVKKFDLLAEIDYPLDGFSITV
ncbi:radical SAM protein, partial [Patescibacteria group bacterium]|nr:radical SAM protein [Patescibacteria group bacterium]